MATIRRLDPADADVIPALTEVLRDVIAGGASVGFLASDGTTELDDYWRGIFASLGPALALWIAEHQGQVVGTVQLAPCQRSNGRHRGDVQKLLVHRSAQGRGVATRLMDAVEAHARASGLGLLVLDTHSGSRAEGLYRNRGWLAAGSIPGFAAVPDGSLIATTYFYKQL
ncbi:MAG: GNAT family N-acetyltransferase [Lysobacteraceae bacterium]|nr:MAG: GNAT family N-acetyltransferase [Xanthomonadaceae bacterium]